MHTGTLIIIASIGTLGIIALISWGVYLYAVIRDDKKSTYYKIHTSTLQSVSAGVLGTFASLFVAASVLGGLVLGIHGVQTASCELTADDLNNTEWDYSWLRRCRIEVTLKDGSVVLTNPSNIRLTEDLRIAVTDPRP